jgi:hypothetical protein
MDCARCAMLNAEICIRNLILFEYIKNPFGLAILYVKSVFLNKTAKSITFKSVFEKNDGMKT